MLTGLTAVEKLSEAAFWLEKIHAPFKDVKEGTAIILIKDALKAWKSYLSAFLTSMRSIPDYLLEDYNVKHSLGIHLTDKLYPETFLERVNRLKDTNERHRALNFLKWWKTKMKEMKEDPICSFLIKLRDISVHRQQIQPDTIKVTLFTSKDSEQSKPAIVHGWFFKGYEDEDVLKMCDKYFAIMKKFVEEAEQFI